jgi:pyruvate kinase
MRRGWKAGSHAYRDSDWEQAHRNGKGKSMQDDWVGRRRRQTGIMATLGTSSSHPDVIAELHDAGTDVFRLDFSHGSLAAHRDRCRTIRALDHQSSRPAAIMADLQGAQFRLGPIVGGFASLSAGQMLRLDLDASPGNRRRLSVPHPEFFAMARSGDELFIDGGRVRLLVMSAAQSHIDAIVLTGGYVADAKRISIPDSTGPVGLTEKDRADASHAAAMGVDWLALPAGCGSEGFDEARHLAGAEVRLMARLDNPAALAHINETLAMADGIMLARQDLAMSMNRKQICSLQKRLFADCDAAGKIMVAAIQALADCERDANDCYLSVGALTDAVHQGAHVLMLSAGSATGAFPVESVIMMERLIRTAECGLCPEGFMDADRAPAEMQVIDEPESHWHQPPRIEMRKRSRDPRMPDDSHMPAPQ